MKLWFRALEAFTREEIARALLRCLREREWLSSYALAEAVKDERRERAGSRSTVLPLPARNREVPPEWKEIRQVLERSKTLPGEPGHMLPAKARERIEELAGYHDRRLAEQSMAPRREGGRS